jgi:hypothetical protein
MVYTTSNDDVAVHLPWTPSTTSNPTTSKISSMRTQSARKINSYFNQTTDVIDSNSICFDIEIDLTLQMIENVWRRARGDPSIPVELTQEQKQRLNILQPSGELQSGHYSVDVP